MDRPDLSGISDEILAYIESLENNIAASASGRSRRASAVNLEPSEPPTTINIITISLSGKLKRTGRHHYPRQRRAGMGIFDLETPEDDPPLFLISADQSEQLLLLGKDGRGYHLAVSDIPETAVRAKGTPIEALITGLESNSIRWVGRLTDQGQLAMTSERGYIRMLRHHYVGQNLRQGAQLLDVGRFGDLASAGWCRPNEDEVFIGTRKGLGIRFRSRLVHPNGSLGIRLDRDDEVVAVTGSHENGQIFLMGSGGKGTVRNMAGFRANKAPGAGGKTALKTELLIAACSVQVGDDIFIASQLSKLIRFKADEIPPKDGVVQGVNLMALRADDVIAACTSPAPTP
jgi:DNA gyrase/topoisomerase IV subunit A